MEVLGGRKFGGTLINPVHLRSAGLWVHCLFQAPLVVLPKWCSYKDKVPQSACNTPSLKLEVQNLSTVTGSVPGPAIIRLPLFLSESLTLKTAVSTCDNQ